MMWPKSPLLCVAFALFATSFADDCPNDCFDHCLKKYGGTLLKGNTYYCAKGCAGVRGGKVQDYDKYCCSRNFEICKDNCKSASTRQHHIEKCEYGCTFWIENQMRSERCSSVCVENSSWKTSNSIKFPLTCYDYAEKKYCENGGIGSGALKYKYWSWDVDTNGVDARSACCVCGGKGKLDEVCFDVNTTVVKWGEEMSWKIFGNQGACELELKNVGGNGPEDGSQHPFQCCVPKDENEFSITCQDSYGDGWHGGYLEIESNGESKTYCTGFSDGKTFDDTLIFDPVDCSWDDFGEWSKCSEKCGEGYRTRSRKELIPAKYGGTRCEGAATQIEACDGENCPGCKQTFVGGCSNFDDILLQSFSYEDHKSCLSECIKNKDCKGFAIGNFKCNVFGLDKNGDECIKDNEDPHLDLMHYFSLKNCTKGGYKLVAVNGFQKNSCPDGTKNMYSEKQCDDLAAACKQADSPGCKKLASNLRTLPKTFGDFRSYKGYADQIDGLKKTKKGFSFLRSKGCNMYPPQNNDVEDGKYYGSIQFNRHETGGVKRNYKHTTYKRLCLKDDYTFLLDMELTFD